MSRADRLYLADIVRAEAEIQAFLAGFSRDAFVNDSRTRSAVLYQLIIVGEATTNLSSELRAKHPDVNWRSVVAFRNRVIHGYATVDWLMVWNAATVDAPLLASQVESILQDAVPPPGLEVQSSGEE